MSKSASETSTPFGFLAAALLAASVTPTKTGLHSATRSGFVLDLTTTVHGALSWASAAPATHAVSPTNRITRRSIMGVIRAASSFSRLPHLTRYSEEN
jgi:hypothetical protein